MLLTNNVTSYQCYNDAHTRTTTILTEQFTFTIFLFTTL